MALLRESGPVPGDENGVKATKADATKKKSRGGNKVRFTQRWSKGDIELTSASQQIDMEKLADGLQKLGEDDLLQVVQMVHDNKSADTYTKNDVESKSEPSIHTSISSLMHYHPDGEFHVDLYTLPDVLVKMLWDFTALKTEM